MTRQKSIPAAIIPVLLLGLLVTLVYWPALNGSFVNYDDPLYITENPVIQQGFSWHTVKWSFTSISVGHWHPATWLSHLAGIQLFGLRPFGHHLINLVIHFTNALLLALALQRMTGCQWRSWMVAVLFAVHPLNVESAAWIAERKGLLAAFFWLLAVHAYIFYTKRPSWLRYLPVLLLFMLGICSKAIAVTLPVALLLLDYWPLARAGSLPGQSQGKALAKLLVEKVPLLLASALAGAGAVAAMQRGGAATGYPLSLRLTNVVRGYTEYVRKLFYPADLSVSYPLDAHPSLWKVSASLALLLAVTLLALALRRKAPYLLAGWLWFLVTLVPVIGFLNLNLGQQTMPDRYAYIPVIGLLVALVWGANGILERLNAPKPAGIALAAVAVVTLGFVAAKQATYWHDSIALFSHEIRVNPASSLAHNNLGSALLEAGDLDGSLRELREALRLDQNNDDAWNNLGVIYGKTGRYRDAVEAYQLALAANPLHVKARLNLGMAYIGLNDMPNAWKEYGILSNLSPADAERMRRYLKGEPPVP
jgi:tetratricopeptide (TPR) repeat protein